MLYLLVTRAARGGGAILCPAAALGAVPPAAAAFLPADCIGLLETHCHGFSPALPGQLCDTGWLGDTGWVCDMGQCCGAAWNTLRGSPGSHQDFPHQFLPNWHNLILLLWKNAFRWLSVWFVLPIHATRVWVDLQLLTFLGGKRAEREHDLLI